MRDLLADPAKLLGVMVVVARVAARLRTEPREREAPAANTRGLARLETRMSYLDAVLAGANRAEIIGHRATEMEKSANNAAHSDPVAFALFVCTAALLEALA